MVLGKRYTLMCACGLVLEAHSRDGLSGVVRTHQMLEHDSKVAPSIVFESRDALRPVS